MLSHHQRWTPPAPEKYILWDGTQIEELRAILAQGLGAWTVEYDHDAIPNYVVISLDGSPVFGVSPGEYVWVGESGSFSRAASLPGLPYPSEWLD